MKLTDADKYLIAYVSSTLITRRADNKEMLCSEFKELQVTISKDEIAKLTERKTVRKVVVDAIAAAFSENNDFAVSRNARGDIVITTLDPDRVKNISHFDSYDELIKYANSL